MTISEKEDFESHSEASQLPLFVAGMLDQAEHKQMEEHLKVCSLCQKELEEEQRLRPTIHEALESWPTPSPRVLQRAKENIAQISRQEARMKIDKLNESPNIVVRIEEWIRRLFVTRWVPAFALLIIVVQGSFLQYLLTSPSTSRPPGMEGPVFERELPPTGPSPHTQRIQIKFHPDRSINAIQTLLRKVHGTIILGPGPEGEFIIELSYSDQGQLNRSMQTFKDSNTVQNVKPLRP